MEIKIREATQSDNRSLIELFKVEMGSNIRITLERGENFFEYQSMQFTKNAKCYVIEDTNEKAIEGCFSIGLKCMRVVGEKKDFQYLSDLRISEKFQGKNILIRVLKYIQNHNLIDLNLPCITLSLSENDTYHSMEDKSFNPELRKRFNIPSTYKWRTIVTNFVSSKSKYKKSSSQYYVRKANKDNIEEIKRFLASQKESNIISEYFDIEDLSSKFYSGLDITSFFIAFYGQSIVGIASLWDQGAFKQTIIKGYSRLFRIARPLINSFGFIVGLSRLPQSGNQLSYDIMSHKVIHKQHIDCTIALAQEMLIEVEKKGKMFLMIGTDKESPELEKIRRFKSRREVEGILYQFSFSGTENFYHNDASYINLEIGRI
jgi:hypothetical protein